MGRLRASGVSIRIAPEALPRTIHSESWPCAQRSSSVVRDGGHVCLVDGTSHLVQVWP